LLPEGHGNLIISPDNGETFYVWRPEFAREFKVVDIRMQDGFVAS
jgi:hypothetical protein